MTIEHLVRPNILRMKAYASGKSEFAGRTEIFLDTNENPFGDNFINRYPDPLQHKLVDRLVEVKSEQFKTKLAFDNISLANGSDVLSDSLIRIFCEPRQDALVYTPPTFGMFRVAADLNDVTPIAVPLDSQFDLDVEGILKQNGTAKLLFLCSPNNPTGNRMSSDRLETLIKTWQGIVVLDEAYIDFCPEDSFVPRLQEFPQLAILHTTSKAWGMAGVRLGMCIASAEFSALLRKVRMPYDIDALKEPIALKNFERPDEIKRQNKLLLSERQRVEQQLKQLPVTVYPSDANFLLAKFPDADAVYRALFVQGIKVRNVSDGQYLIDCLRISIGTPLENDRLLNVLNDFFSHRS